MNLREEGKSVRNNTLEAWRTGAIGPKLRWNKLFKLGIVGSQESEIEDSEGSKQTDLTL